MRQRVDTITVATRRGLNDVTRAVSDVVRAAGIREGLCTVFIRHTSASLVIQENADPAVCRDLEAFLDRLVPEGDALYTHVTEGDDDMPSHIKAALTRTSEQVQPISKWGPQVPVIEGVLALGTWQGLYVWEHRRGRHRRDLAIHVAGE